MLVVGGLSPLAADDGRLAYRVANVKSHDQLNLRAAPGTSSAIIHRIAHDARGLVFLGDRDGPWMRVEVDGRQGWVHSYHVVADVAGWQQRAAALYFDCPVE
jgi:uncharacterized protein YraI